MLALLAAASPAASQQVDPKLWGTDGYVQGITRSGNTIYVSGFFTRIGPNSGGGVVVDRGTGRAIAGFPQVAGVVEVAMPDGTGG